MSYRFPSIGELIPHPRTTAGWLIGVVLLSGGYETIHGFEEQHKRDARWQSEYTIHYVTDFEKLDAKDIAIGMGAVAVDEVAREITEETGSTITPGEKIVISDYLLKIPDHRRF